MRPHAGAKGGNISRGNSEEEEHIEFNGHERLICEEGMDESDEDNSQLLGQYSY